MTRAKSQTAYELIKQKIFDGVYPPLSDISEEILQQELGISRTPIHEALQRLGDEGFVNIYPRKGTIVTEMTLDTIYWIYEARELNEPYITRHACGRLPVQWLKRMQKEYQSRKDNNDKILTMEERKHFIQLDFELHNAIVGTCRNAFIRDMMLRVGDHSHRLRIRTSTLNREYDCSIQEHLDIIDALLRDDLDAAEAAAYQQIRAAKAKAFEYY